MTVSSCTIDPAPAVHSGWLSEHAERRVNQRGIDARLLGLILAHADHEHDVGGGCLAVRISRRRLGHPSVRMAFGADIDRAARICVIWSEVTAEIVTVLHDRPGEAGRRYRRAH